jgi:tRNA1Val (adenine37-N6)-methyltransferase
MRKDFLTTAEIFTPQIKIFQPEEMKVNQDILAFLDFIHLEAGDLAIDLGTGTGVIPVVLAKRKKLKEIWGVEIQRDLVRLAYENVRVNQLSSVVKILEGDLRKLNEKFPAGFFDIVLANPPYYKKNQGRISPSLLRAIAKSEIKCQLEDVIKIGHYLLKKEGRLFLMMLVSRFEEVKKLLEKYQFFLRRTQYIGGQRKKHSIIFLAEMEKL